MPAHPAPMSPAGGLPSLPPVNPAFSFVSAPIPPTPFPAGRWRFLLYFAGGSAPGTPALNRLRHLQFLPSMSPAGGLPGWSPADLAVPVSKGGLPSLPPVNPAFSFVSAPIPPPPFPTGRGRFLVFLCKGLRPLHPRDLNPRGTGSAGVSGARGGARGDGRRLTLPLWYPARACPVGRLLTLPFRHPAGGLPSLPPVAPANPAPTGGLCPASPVFPAIS